MNEVSGITGNLAFLGSQLTRFSPEPRNRGLSFGGVLKSVGSALSTTANAFGGGVDPVYLGLINQQIEAQQQMQLVSFISNIEKSKHETQMAAVRNVRVG